MHHKKKRSHTELLPRADKAFSYHVKITSHMCTISLNKNQINLFLYGTFHSCVTQSASKAKIQKQKDKNEEKKNLSL